MTSLRRPTLEEEDPVVYTDGREVFGRFMEEYVVHDRGFFIVAPSGAGKTYFVEHQTEKHWIDGDDLWIAAGAHPPRPWWTEGMERIYAVDQRSDVITEQARRLGLWIIGASHYWVLPDALVVPDWETHQRYINERETDHYDGGATSKDLEMVLNHRKVLEELAESDGVPLFPSVHEAAAFLQSTLQEELARESPNVSDSTSDDVDP